MAKLRRPSSPPVPCILLAAMLLSLPLTAQEPAAETIQDNRKRVEIIHVDRIKSMMYEGKTIDRLLGNVQLMHNGALMSCDSAYLFSSSEFEAYSRVTIVQNSTRLYGDFLHYDGRTNIAQVRGKLVRLLDSTATLRTQHLDFNTKDNIGHFFNGGVIDNNDSQLESIHGYYYSNDKLFVFSDSVEMHNETYDIRCEAGNYNTRTDVATFLAHTDIWHRDGFLACDYGWYDKKRDWFYFSQNAYILSKEQEIWADSIFYNRQAAMGDLYGHVEVLDTVQQSIAFGNEAHFFENPQQVTLTRQASVAYYTNENNRPDTLFIRADTLHFITEYLTASDSLQLVADSSAGQAVIAADSSRLQVAGDSSRLQAAADSSRLQVAADSSHLQAAADSSRLQAAGDSSHFQAAVDSSRLQATMDSSSLQAAADSSRFQAAADSLQPASDSLPTDTPDSTIRKVFAWFNVRAFRQDIQAVCDSFAYSSLDSLGRMFGRPAMWNRQQQITAKEIHFLSDPQQRIMIRADFLEAAFIITQEQDTFFNQVKGRDIIGHFRDNDLYLIDVFGGAQTVYYLQEDSLVADGNIAESATMQIEVKNRKIRRIKYFEKPISNTYPLDQLPQEKAVLKGFEWRDAERPKSRWEICPEIPRPSRRQASEALPKPTFPIRKTIEHRQ
ncbi:MAG: hypothetical protein LBS12_06165 [Prevotellaceae bacterium]|jgi:lipopolysaccharide export system protein LptA|nr:hypothetical protein [Prevotellaceae bacterium]